MNSPLCERALADARKFGKAILKFVSANDVGITGGHQCGFYLPKQIWEEFSPFPPTKGENFDHPVKVLWPEGEITSSVVKWYGRGTRSEYRLTRFGRDFRWRTADTLGNLLVLIPETRNAFRAYVLDLDEDIQNLQAELGVEVLDSWAFYQRDSELEETEDECLNRKFREFAAIVEAFPEVRLFSDATRSAIVECIPEFNTLTLDDQIVRLVKEEYTLYRIVERRFFTPEILRVFKSIDDFLDTAQRITQARKSRAGRSLENHVEYILKSENIPFQMRQIVDDTRPDVIIPNKAAYDNPEYPERKLFMVGVKTTCKDRWRQVIREAPRIKRKYIFTMQRGISSSQMAEIDRSRVTLIVPSPLHGEYPRDCRPKLLDVREFVAKVRRSLNG